MPAMVAPKIGLNGVTKGAAVDNNWPTSFGKIFVKRSLALSKASPIASPIFLKGFPIIAPIYRILRHFQSLLSSDRRRW